MTTSNRIGAVVVIFATLIAVLTHQPTEARSSGFQEGDSVVITGRGLYNPYCTGIAKILREFNDPNFICTERSVPSSGNGSITANDDGAWRSTNGYYRVCLSERPFSCGWYNQKSLRKTPLALPLILK